MEKFLIEGGMPCSGRVTPAGSKNEALPTIATALLSSVPVTLHNVPKIQDVLVMLDVVTSLGAGVKWIGDHSVVIDAGELSTARLDPDLCRKIRASILFAGPVVGRLGEVILPPPGGDVIGRRRVDTHLNGFASLGASVSVAGSYRLAAPEGGLKGADIFFDEQSVTATENLVTAAAMARGTTVLRNVAMEPHVQGVCRMLRAMGVQIDGIGTPTLTIEGRGGEPLSGCEHTIGPDYLEIGSLVGLAAVTGGEMIIEGVRADDLRMVRLVFDRIGVKTELHLPADGNGNEATAELFVPGRQKLRIKPDYLGHIPKIDDAPWPAFPTDLMSVAIVVATQSEGTSLFFEKMFEGRMFFVDHLIAMGAQIILCDPHRVVVVGPSPLYAATHESPDIRAGMALLLAASCARGKSTILNIRQIDRGYERMDDKLRGLGMAITRVPA